jgi:hypothetical protein
MVKTYCFIKKILLFIKSDGTFGNYVGAQEQKYELRNWKFDILRVPSIKMPTKKF